MKSEYQILIVGGGNAANFVGGGTTAVSLLRLRATYPMAWGTVTAAPPVAYASTADAPVSATL